MTISIRTFRDSFHNAVFGKTKTNYPTREEIESLFKISLIYKDIYCMLPFQHRSIKPIIMDMKSKNLPEAVMICAEILHKALCELQKSTDGNIPMFIIPLPSSPIRKMQKGFNQCESLAKALETNFKYITVRNLLRKNLWSGFREQKASSRSERLNLTSDQFQIRNTTKHDLKAMYIIIDDVVTTGSTLRAAINAMQKAGFMNVAGLAIAH
ncbi:MAG: hypothetical protein V4526_01600 [Patescibacteria group bacterium]